MIINSSHHELVASIAALLEPGWKKLLIGIDGVYGSGKSQLSRYLGYQLGITVVESDLFLSEQQPSEGYFSYRYAELERIVNQRLKSNSPVIFEGVCLANILKMLNVVSDYSVWVSREEHDDYFSHPLLGPYQAEYLPKEKANFVLQWQVSPNNAQDCGKNPTEITR